MPLRNDDIIDREAIELARRLIPVVSAEQLIERIESYAISPYLPPETALTLVRAAIVKWKEDH